MQMCAGLRLPRGRFLPCLLNVFDHSRGVGGVGGCFVLSLEFSFTRSIKKEKKKKTANLMQNGATVPQPTCVKAHRKKNEGT